MPTYIDTALREILNDNPGINPLNIELFHQVYYPIAKVELEMDEKCFGDFDTIEKTVLELVSAGFDSAEAIAKLLGVSGWFVHNIFRILSGYGHMDETNHITELGRNSLQADTKITEVLIKQIVSIDGLTGYPIDIENTVANGEIVDVSDFGKDKFIIPSVPETETKAFLNRLNSDANVRAMSKKRQVININVTNIRDAQLITTEYASAFLMCIKKRHTPIVFVKMYNPNKKIFRERFSWQPLSIDSTNKALFENSEIYVTHDLCVKTALFRIYESMLEKHGESNDRFAEKVFQEDAERKFKFKCEFLTMDIPSGKCTISREALTEINISTLNLLVSFAKYGAFVYTHDRLNGKVIMLTPDGTIPCSVLRKLKVKADAMGFGQLLEWLSAEQNTELDIMRLIEKRLDEN